MWVPTGTFRIIVMMLCCTRAQAQVFDILQWWNQLPKILGDLIGLVAPAEHKWTTPTKPQFEVSFLTTCGKDGLTLAKELVEKEIKSIVVSCSADKREEELRQPFKLVTEILDEASIILFPDTEEKKCTLDNQCDIGQYCLLPFCPLNVICYVIKRCDSPLDCHWKGAKCHKGGECVYCQKTTVRHSHYNCEDTEGSCLSKATLPRNFHAAGVAMRNHKTPESLFQSLRSEHEDKKIWDCSTATPKSIIGIVGKSFEYARTKCPLAAAYKSVISTKFGQVLTLLKKDFDYSIATRSFPQPRGGAQVAVEVAVDTAALESSFYSEP